MVTKYTYKFNGKDNIQVLGVDSSLKEGDLEQMIKSKQGSLKINLRREKSIRLTDSFDSVMALNVEVKPGRYEVPEKLQAYRKAVEVQSDAKGRYNGLVAIIEGGVVKTPLPLIQGGFYDFIATDLSKVPSEMTDKLLGYSEIFHLLEEYPKGKTIKRLFEMWGIPVTSRARYVGCAYLMFTSGGDELTVVQRAKGMAVAADCISSVGSTPNPDFSKGYTFQEYLKGHMAEEMNEELGLDIEEFEIKRVHLFDDEMSMPFLCNEVTTTISAEEITERICGKKQAIEEHPVLYAVEMGGVQEFADTFPVYSPIRVAMKNLFN